MLIDDEHSSQDGGLYSYSSAASVTQFLTLVDELHELITLVDALKKRGFQFFETQMSGPVFVNTCHSTLDLEKLLFIPT